MQRPGAPARRSFVRIARAGYHIGMGLFANLQNQIQHLVERAGGRKNLLFIVIGIIIAGIVAVGWGLSELQTSQAIVMVGNHI
jgi:hypothetical protein